MHSDRHELRAGPVAVTYTAGDLRYLKVDGVEAVRRVFVGVRDPAWGTVPGDVSAERIEQRGGGFSVTFASRHRRGVIDFEWRGCVEARAEGSGAVVCYEMAGRARRSFGTNRTGICVLHPVNECVGRQCTVEHPDGTRERREFPTLIAPHQVFREVRRLTYGAVEVEFEGEVFETEDQRNWSDGSFKTYCRPLDRGFAYELREGQEVRQAVVVRVTGGDGSTAPVIPRNVITVGEAVGRLPELGLCGDNERVARELGLAHLRRQTGPNVVVEGNRVIVVPAGRPFPSIEEVVAERAKHPGKVVGGGTAGNFAEVNRNRDRAAAMDVLSWLVNPQVHATDDLSLVENLQGQADAVRTARSFAPRAQLAVGPIILHRRPDPFAAGKAGSEAEPVEPDPRQRAPFASAWTLLSIKRLAEAGADSLTYYQTDGPFGVKEGATRFPVYDLFRRLGTMRGAEVLACRSSDELAFDALALHRGDRLRVFVASLADVRQELEIRGMPGGPRRVALEPFQVLVLRCAAKERTS